jgi:hypothetical protein
MLKRPTTRLIYECEMLDKPDAPEERRLMDTSLFISVRLRKNSDPFEVE